MKKNYFFYLLLSISNILFPIISFPYVSKIIGPTGIGKVQFITSYAQYFGLIAALGIPIYGIRETAKYKHDRLQLNKLFSELSVIYFFTSVVLTIIYLLTLWFVPVFQHERNLYMWSALVILLSFTSVDWFYEGLEQFKTVAIRSMIVRTLTLICMFLFIKHPADYYWYLIIIIFTALTNNGVNMVRLHRSVSIQLKGLNFKRHLKPLFLIFSTTIASSMYTMLDTVLLGFLANAHSVGLYTAASRLCKIALPIVTSLGIVLVPSLAKNLSLKNYTETQLTLNRSFTFTAFFAIPIGFGLALLAPEFIIAFSSKSFLEATLAMQILAFLPLLIGFGYFFGFQILVPDGKDREMLLSVLSGVFISLLLNILLVPALKDVGAALANVISEFLVTCCYIYFVRKYYIFTFPYKALFTATCSSLVFIPIILLMRSLHLNVYISIISIVPLCALAYLTMQKFVFKEVLMAEHIEPFVLKKYHSIKNIFTSKRKEIYG